MIKKTFSDIKEIDEIYGRLIGDGKNGFEQTKLGYAFKRFTEKNTKKIFSEFNDILQDIRINNALTDKSTGAILYKPDGQSFQFSPDGLKAVLKGIKDTTNEWENKEFDIEPFICSDIGTIELSDEEREILTGALI